MINHTTQIVIVYCITLKEHMGARGTPTATSQTPRTTTAFVCPLFDMISILLFISATPSYVHQNT